MRCTLIFGISLFLQQGLSAQKISSMNDLKRAVINELASQNGEFAVSFYDLNTQRSFDINGDTIFHAASTMKTPVMIEVFRQADQGKFSLDDSLIIRNEFKSIVDGSLFQLSPGDDSDSSVYLNMGKKMSIYDLMYRMIIHSSNLATNLVIDLVGAKNVMHTIQKLGIKKMKVLRGVEDQKAYDLGLNNVTTANDLVILFKAIANGKIVNRSACDSMIHILEDQQHNRVIPALLPSDVKIAHKTGNITGVQHDSGIVFLPDGKKYVLVLLSKNLTNEESGIQAMARVSRMIYDYIISH